MVWCTALGSGMRFLKPAAGLGKPSQACTSLGFMLKSNLLVIYWLNFDRGLISSYHKIMNSRNIYSGLQNGMFFMPI